ncbi:L,D-peptidoglycan transpeptidase YkuD, ErfK/YbiS/YcfS/YnhG family [Bosea sp. OK403]|uniref:L,D-transpeptidase family protein n=1 Tax=Bosea sp. OK403 TaxID=1855286 RepID=UPI0008E51A63|nr:L,D-transpeptidase family protein [Bosea sp. OK403]SFJ93876.1 L,D-peptidoglycan transpeptidase YkuD, ErfK/YbiS/YcfS/YnhG family [Bosea sp. OK403]
MRKRESPITSWSVHKPRGLTRLRVFASVRDRSKGFLVAGGAVFPCALGRSGIVVLKREGDGGTPRAALPLRSVLYRKARLPRPRTLLPLRAITARDAWCDDAGDRRYNRLIARPPGAAEERLQRDDHLYDVIVELGWNDAPVIRGRGSAIFWHLARSGFTPTAGCVAVEGHVFAKVLPRLARHCVLVVR